MFNYNESIETLKFKHELKKSRLNNPYCKPSQIINQLYEKIQKDDPSVLPKLPTPSKAAEIIRNLDYKIRKEQGKLKNSF